MDLLSSLELSMSTVWIKQGESPSSSLSDVSMLLDGVAGNELETPTVQSFVQKGISGIFSDFGNDWI